MLQRARLLVVRLTALLVMVVAGVRGTAPVIDGLLHHRDVTQEQSGVHLDKPGGCGSHAERCAVRGHSSGIRYAPGSRMAKSRVARSSRLARSADCAAVSRGTTSTHHSRAPPTPSA